MERLEKVSFGQKIFFENFRKIKNFFEKTKKILESMSPNLLYTSVMMQTRRKCLKDLKGQVTEFQVCGGGWGKDTCQG